MQKMNKPRIGIDLMGSDTFPKVLLEAVLELTSTDAAEFYLFGQKEIFPNHSLPVHGIEAPDVIEMTDDPLLAIRRKKKSSVCVGIHHVHEKKIDAFISFGNTGALMASAKLILKMLPGIDRPALLALLPAKHNEIAVLDVGANTTFKPEHLLQFAKMGIAYQKSRGIDAPKVGLLNIGSEAQKGSPEMRKAYQALQSLPDFVGNIEGRYALASPIDVLVTDGFTGNVFLKTAEGIAHVIREELQEIESTPNSTDAYRALMNHLNYSQYPGALLAGVDGIVMKCHGEFSNLALKSTINAAIRLVNNAFLTHLKSSL